MCDVAKTLVAAVEHYMRVINVDTLGMLNHILGDGGRADAHYLDEREAWMDAHHFKASSLMQVVHAWTLEPEDSLAASLLDESIKHSVADALRVIHSRRRGEYMVG
jgi:hypothetical protein